MPYDGQRINYKTITTNQRNSGSASACGAWCRKRSLKLLLVVHGAHQRNWIAIVALSK